MLSAPSGTGKTTLSRRLIRRIPGIRFSISYTTRPPRPGERDGVDYHFVSDEDFERLRRRGEFLEWARVDGANYGTSRRQVSGSLGRGEDLLLDIDTQGAAQVRRRMRNAVLVFLLPPGWSALRNRHRKRGSDSGVIARRLELARREVGQCGRYDYLVFNDRFEQAGRELEAIVLAERCRTRRQLERARPIVRAFLRGARRSHAR